MVAFVKLRLHKCFAEESRFNDFLFIALLSVTDRDLASMLVIMSINIFYWIKWTSWARGGPTCDTFKTNLFLIYYFMLTVLHCNRSANAWEYFPRFTQTIFYHWSFRSFFMLYCFIIIYYYIITTGANQYWYLRFSCGFIICIKKKENL